MALETAVDDLVLRRGEPYLVDHGRIVAALGVYSDEFNGVHPVATVKVDV